MIINESNSIYFLLSIWSRFSEHPFAQRKLTGREYIRKHKMGDIF